MIYTLPLAILGVGIAGSCYFLWRIHCTNEAYRQKSEMLDIVKRAKMPPMYKIEMLDAIKAVSFYEHESALAWFRNPLNLYSEKLVALLLASEAK